MRNSYVWCSFTLLSLSCGDDAGTTGKTLAELSSAEAHELCLELRPYSLRSWSGACTEEALDSDPSGGEQCKTERKACIEDSVGDCSMSSDSEDDGDCQAARVADVRECIKLGAQLSEQQRGKDVDCSTGLQPTSSAAPHIPAACKRVDERCDRGSSATAMR